MTDAQLNVWERAMGWRKRQMVTAQVNNEVTQKIRNDTLEEVALEFERMRSAFGDTADSFAHYVREMKT
jgi:hypothetical protein